MITAAEARELTANSDTAINTLMKEVEKIIRTAADQGKNSAFIDDDQAKLWSAVPVHLNPSPNTFQLAVITRLGQLGFSVRFMADGDPYIPRALLNDDGTGPMHCNVGLYVSW